MQKTSYFVPHFNLLKIFSITVISWFVAANLSRIGAPDQCMKECEYVKGQVCIVISKTSRLVEGEKPEQVDHVTPPLHKV